MENDAIFTEAQAALEAEAPKLGLRANVSGAGIWGILLDLAVKMIGQCMSPTPALAANPTIGMQLAGRLQARRLNPGARPKEIKAMVDTVFAAAAKATQEKLEAFQTAAQSVQA